jgi:alcohol dehydrogenase (cytochrome c)
VVLSTNRNAFFYVLDRQNGKFLHGKPYAKQTWAKGLDDSGRPILLPNSSPTEAGNLIWPSLAGATNWFSPAYNPQTNLFYAAVREEGAYYFKGEADYKPGVQFNGGGQRSNPDEEPYGAIRALDPETASVKWEFRMHRPANAGVLTTAGDLVFSGTQSDFFALHARNGKLLWRFRTGGGIAAAPVSYSVDGKQQIAIAAGRALFVFKLGE